MSENHWGMDFYADKDAEKREDVVEAADAVEEEKAARECERSEIQKEELDRLRAAENEAATHWGVGYFTGQESED
ncbi:hypothetical protein [Trueperella pecoris]|uniref:Uncharacterized protein n=1 Tax=Trueperella pecoris TaxID=2733571 RepID=A0A7M1QWN6_9ACTO|nr:hypothetical protein [Trueperella pecoris]QOQ39454.1 hypothetical protein HLG82_08380 [Trueperella pecoris]QOR45924.1 hypothetical protein INS88_01480 [Trueperella pecoris]QTG75754.1 hypothetical protein J4179_01390 [Trueperella pecoris]